MSKFASVTTINDPKSGQNQLGLLIQAPLAYNGISTQPSHARRVDHVEDAVNVLFSVRDGCKRRPGTHIVQHIYSGATEGPLPAGNNQLHFIGRSRDESYLVVHNRTASGASIRVLDLQANEWVPVVSNDPAVDAYLNVASPDAFRFRPYLDKTLVINTEVEIDGDNTAGTIDNTTMPMLMTRTFNGAGSTKQFEIDLIDWDARGSRGSSTTNVLPKIFTDGERKIADACFWMDRLHLYVGEAGQTSQAGDYFDLWVEDPTSGLSDRDPIAFRVQGLRYAPIDHAIPTRGGIWITSKTGHQFVFRPGQVLSPTNFRIDPTTSFAIESARPAYIEPNLYVAIKHSDYAELIEILASESYSAGGGRSVSNHASTLIEMQAFPLSTHEAGVIRTIDAMPEGGLVFMLRRDKLDAGQTVGRNLFVYRTFNGSDAQGREGTVQQAWTVCDFEGITGIHDIAVVGTDVYILAHYTVPSSSDAEFFIVRWSPLGEGENRAFETPTEQTTFIGLNT